MNKYLILICLFLFGGILSSTAQEDAQYKVVTVGFYNFENLFDTLDTPNVKDTEFSPQGSKVWNSDKYNEKIANMAYVVSQLGTELNPKGIALLGVAEIENDTVVMDVLNHPLLKDRNYGLIHHSSQDFRGIDVALIYRTDIFKPIKDSIYAIEIFDKGERKYTRDILMVTGELDGERIHLMVNHWPSRRGGEKKTAPRRNKGAAICKSIIDSIRVHEPNVKAFVMGDFNDNPNDESLSGILKGIDKKNKVKGDMMFNPMLAMFKKGFGSNAYRDTWSLFDQILLTPGLIKDAENGFIYHKAEIYDEKYLKTASGRYKGYPKRTFSGDTFVGGYSDHFPVYVHLIKEI